MTTNHDEAIEVVKLDLHVLRSEHDLERPYLVVTTDPRTKNVSKTCVRLLPRKANDSQSGK